MSPAPTFAVASPAFAAAQTLRAMPPFFRNTARADEIKIRVEGTTIDVSVNPGSIVFSPVHPPAWASDFRIAFKPWVKNLMAAVAPLKLEFVELRFRVGGVTADTAASPDKGGGATLRQAIFAAMRRSRQDAANRPVADQIVVHGAFEFRADGDGFYATCLSAVRERDPKPLCTARHPRCAILSRFVGVNPDWLHWVQGFDFQVSARIDSAHARTALLRHLGEAA